MVFCEWFFKGDGHERDLHYPLLRRRQMCIRVSLGAERHLAEVHDLRWAGAIVARNGVVEETGLGAGVLNDPVTSVLWLARRLADYGQQIDAGDIVLSGSFIRPVECPPKSEINADFGPFGSVNIAFA